MKKSGKKVKSDRINSLRKQYDAFLEEDKKRKERNEYILGKLDKMRNVTAVVPLRHKSNMHVVEARSPVAYNRSVFIPENYSKKKENTPRNCLEERPLIHEISKKYILIPRITPTLSKDYLKDRQKVYDTTDWKSKYDILEQLKKNEKEEQTDKYEVSPSDLFPEKESTRNKLIENFNLNKYQTENYELISNYRNELPEKDLSDRKLYCEPEDVKKYKQIEIENRTGNISESSKDSEILNVNKEVSDKKLQNTTQNYDDKTNNIQKVIYDNNFDFGHQPTEITNMKSLENPEVEIVDTNIESECSTQIEPSTYEDLPAEQEKSNTEDSEKVVLQDRGELRSFQITNPYNLVKEIDDEVPLKTESVSPKNLESPIKIIDSHEFTPNEDVTLEEPSSTISVNINPEEHTITQTNLDPSNQYELETPIVAENINNSVDTNEIKQLDVEQKEMLYSENTDMNYAYNQESVENTYDAVYQQESAENTYDAEYQQESAENTHDAQYQQESVENTNDAEYPQESENYQQNEEYTYYEGAQPDQTYPAEINEHQESSEHYDQTYEQQYANFEQQEYVQQQEEYEQQLQQYEQDQTAFESYDQPALELDQSQYEQQQNYDLKGSDEQQLNNEQGIVEAETIERDESVVISQDSQQAEQEVK